jgi:octanoyl-[GcvH]:protein N-octanoyltransferase
VKQAFPGRFQLIDDTALSAVARPSPLEYAAWVKEKLASLQPGDEGILRFRRPKPTAAFSPQDTTHPDYERIKEQARANGFEPIERGTGGRLTMFDERALAITLLAPHPEPHLHTMKRYEIFSNIVADALKALGIDARVGELPNEYCPGKYSINAEGRVKLVGIAQRMNRRCVQMGAIISVERSDKACAAIAEAYSAMGLSFDTQSYGAICDLKPTLSYNEVIAQFIKSVSAAVSD